MRSSKRRVADDSDGDDDDDIAYTKKKQDYSDDDDDLPSFAAVASTSSKKAGTRTSLRKASAAASSSSTSSAPAPVPKSTPAPGPAPARRARPKSTAASKAAATASQTVAKKVLTAAEQEELRKIREKEREEDDFFTSKREFTFKTGGKHTALSLPKSRVAPSSSSKQAVKAKPTQKIVINLDQEEYSSSSDSHSDSGSDSSETRAKRKRRKKSKTPVKLASPTKRAASSSSSSSSDSDSDSSAQRRKKRIKAEKKEASKPNGVNGVQDRKGKGRAEISIKDDPANRERSLSPLAQADTFEVAHALQDIRRHRPSMGRRYNVSSEGEDLGQEANDELGDLVGIDGPAGSHTSRSRSASHHARGDSTDPLGHNTHTRTSMTPFADDHELTEEEKEAKYGPVTSISVKMVHDPRIVVTDQNKNGVKRYTAAMDIKVRSRENFENVFGRVSTEKGIARGDIVITYNGQRLYSVGTPHSLSILSSASFEAYPREVFEYVQQQRREQKARELAQAREHQLESIARVNMPGAQRNRAIDIDEADEGRHGLTAIAEDGNDSDIEMITPVGGRLASLQPAGAANRRDERSVSLAAADSGASAAPKEPALKVTIRGGPQQQLNLRVPLTKTISTLIKAYLKKFNHDMALSSKCKVFFDGEALSHDLKLEDADIEDEDTLDIRVPSS